MFVEDVCSSLPSSARLRPESVDVVGINEAISALANDFIQIHGHQDESRRFLIESCMDIYIYAHISSYVHRCIFRYLCMCIYTHV